MAPAALAIYVVLGLIDYWQPPQDTLLALHAVVAIFALLALRYGLHAVLLHEEHAVQVGHRACARTARWWCRRCRSARTAAMPCARRRAVPAPGSTSVEEAAVVSPPPAAAAGRRCRRPGARPARRRGPAGRPPPPGGRGYGYGPRLRAGHPAGRARRSSTARTSS